VKSPADPARDFGAAVLAAGSADSQASTFAALLARNGRRALRHMVHRRSVPPEFVDGSFARGVAVLAATKAAIVDASEHARVAGECSSAILLSCYYPRSQPLIAGACDVRGPVLAALADSPLEGLINTG
jgi:hypothetical protein